jgi:hypothetical protein
MQVNNYISSQTAQTAGTAQAQFEINNGINSPALGDWVYNNLPDLLKAGSSVFKTERQRDVFLTGAISILSGCFNEVQGLYDGKTANANLYCFIVAPPASDKGVLTCAKELGMGIHTRLMDENQEALKRYKAELAQYKAACKAIDGYAVTNPVPGEPAHKLLYIPANSSAAAIMRHIQQNDGGGVICETEADTLTNTFKQEWGNFDDLLRKAFHQEAFSYSRKTNSEYVEVLRPKTAVALSGTPGQASRLLVSGENGLVSRFLFYYYSVPAKWHSVAPSQNINLDSYFKELSERVYQAYAALKGKEVEFTLTPTQWGNLDELFASKLAVANADLRSTVVRLGLVVFKIAMVLTILRNEHRLTEDNKLVCNDTDFRIAFNLANLYQAHADLVYQSLLIPRQRGADNIKTRFFEALPAGADFTRKEALDTGRALTISERQVDNYLKEMSGGGALQLVKHGVYVKL